MMHAQRVPGLDCVADDNELVIEQRVQQLIQWVGKQHVRTLYDSANDEFTQAVFHGKILNKPSVALIGVTGDGDVFGGYYQKAVQKVDEPSTDDSVFLFSLESHGRCLTPQQFPLKRELKETAGVMLVSNNKFGFVRFYAQGHGGLWLGSPELKTCCYQLSETFTGLTDATLMGSTPSSVGSCFQLRRLIALQLY